MEDSYAYCEQLVRAADKDRYLASLFIVGPARRHILALYAFNAEVAAVRDRTSEPMAGEVRLQWWRDALIGDASGGAEGNPVAAAMIETLRHHPSLRRNLERLLEARAFDLYSDPMPSLDALRGYLNATASSLFEMAGTVVGEDEKGIARAAEPAGLAYGLAGLLRSLPQHASRGQIFLPPESLEAFGVQSEDILAGHTTPELRAALTALRDDVRKHLAEAKTRMAGLSSTVRSAFLSLSLVELYLERMDRTDYDPFRTLIEVPQWRRQWRLWRASRPS
jgi:phytoene synthase